MRTNTQRGSASTYAVMLVATLSVTLGVAFTTFSAAERTDAWVLSLAMLCFAEVVLFLFPIYHGRRVADHRAPAFVFGMGLQAGLGIYAAGIVVLSLLSGFGTLRYSLVERAALADGVQLQSLKSTGQGSVAEGGGAVLATGRALPAGESDRFDLVLTVKGDAAALQRMLACATVAWSSASELGALSSSVRLSPCAGGPTVVDRTGDLEVRKVLTAAPVARGEGSFDIPYRIEVRNERWFVSFRSLAVAHAVWFLGLILLVGTWRLGSGFATRLDTESKAQRAEFSEVRARMASLNRRAESNSSAPLQPVVAAIRKLQDDVAFATPESPAGTESHTREILLAIERLAAAYTQVQNAPEAEVSALLDNVRHIGYLLHDRNAAVIAAR